MPQAMKIPDAKAAVDKEIVGKARNIDGMANDENQEQKGSHSKRIRKTEGQSISLR